MVSEPDFDTLSEKITNHFIAQAIEKPEKNEKNLTSMSDINLRLSIFSN